MGDEYVIEWLASPRSDPRVLRRTSMVAASLDVAVAQARIELGVSRRLDDTVEGFRLLHDGKKILSRWLHPDGSLTDLPLPPKMISGGAPPASDDEGRSDGEPEASLRAA